MAVRRWLDIVSFEDITNGGVTDVEADVRQRTADAVVTPDRVLFREVHGQINDYLTHPWPAMFLLFAIRVIPFVGY